MPQINMPTDDMGLGTTFSGPAEMLPGSKGIRITANQPGRTIPGTESECNEDYRNDCVF